MFPDKLKELRKGKKKTQQDMADYLGITRQGYAKYENGQAETDLETLKKLAKYFSVTTDYLTGYSDQPHLTEDEAFADFIKDPSLRRWFKSLPESEEEDIARLKRIWDAFKDE